MTKASDRLYCEKCKNRPTCKQPCASVELLLKTVTTREEHDRELPKEFISNYKITHAWPESRKDTKRLIFELYYLDGRTRKDIALLAGVSYERVKKIIQRENKRIKIESERQITKNKKKSPAN